MANDNIHSKHRERLRERYLKDGIDSFEPHQVLELVLFYAIPRKDTNNLAHELLNRFGSLSGVFEAPVEDLCQVEGIGMGTAVYLNMFSQIIRKYEEDKGKSKVDLTDPKDVGAFCVSLFKGRIYECLFLISLNSQNHLINCEKIVEGTVSEAVVYPRNIVHIALSSNASKVIIAHNHPGGTTTPSTEDMAITTKIKAALNIVGVELCDHIIVSGNSYESCMVF